MIPTTLTLAMQILSYLPSAIADGKIVFKTVTDAEEFAVNLAKTITGNDLTADERAKMTAHRLALSADLQSIPDDPPQ